MYFDLSMEVNSGEDEDGVRANDDYYHAEMMEEQLFPNRSQESLRDFLNIDALHIGPRPYNLLTMTSVALRDRRRTSLIRAGLDDARYDNATLDNARRNLRDDSALGTSSAFHEPLSGNERLDSSSSSSSLASQWWAMIAKNILEGADARTVSGTDKLRLYRDSDYVRLDRNDKFRVLLKTLKRYGDDVRAFVGQAIMNPDYCEYLHEVYPLMYRFASTDMMRIWRAIDTTDFVSIVLPVLLHQLPFDNCDSVCSMFRFASDETELRQSITLKGPLLLQSSVTCDLVALIFDVVTRGFLEIAARHIEFARKLFHQLTEKGAFALAVPFSFFLGAAELSARMRSLFVKTGEARYFAPLSHCEHRCQVAHSNHLSLRFLYLLCSIGSTDSWLERHPPSSSSLARDVTRILESAVTSSVGEICDSTARTVLLEHGVSSRYAHVVPEYELCAKRTIESSAVVFVDYLIRNSVMCGRWCRT